MQPSKTKTVKFFLYCAIFLGLNSCDFEKGKPPAKDSGPVAPPKQIVTVAQAQTMYQAYGERRVPLIEKFENEQYPEEKFSAARYGSYEYQTIKDYLTYIEQEAKKANVEISNLRIYFSNYPNENKFENGRAIKHPRQNSFFIIPTTKGPDKEDRAFYIEESEDGQHKAVFLQDNMEAQNGSNSKEDQLKTQKSEASLMPNFFTAMAPKYRSLILNEGDMTPPPPPTN